MRMRFDIKKVGHLVILERICVEKKERGEIRERRRKKIKGDPHTTHMYTHCITNKGLPR